MNTKKLIPEEILAKIKQIKIATRRVLSGMLIGDTRTAIKGTGFDFDQIRAYYPGDDIRFIDWKASARTDGMLIKQFIEERNRTIHVLVDISPSGNFTTTNTKKQDVAAQIASIIALSSFYGKDRVGLTLFSDTIHNIIPPANTHAHVKNCIKTVFTEKTKKTGTNITLAVEHLLKVEKTKSVVFIISDFIDDNFDEKKLGQLAKKHDVIAVRCLDKREQHLPSVGIIHVTDIETEEEILINTSDKKALKEFFDARTKVQNKIFAKYGIDLLEITSDAHNIVDTVIMFFKKRMRY